MVQFHVAEIQLWTLLSGTSSQVMTWVYQDKAAVSSIDYVFRRPPLQNSRDQRALESKIVASFFGIGKAEYTCCLCASSGPMYSQCWLIQAPLVASFQVFEKRSLWSHAVPQQWKCTHCHSNHAFSFISGLQLVPCPPYSPTLSPCDWFIILLPQVKKHYECKEPGLRARAPINAHLCLSHART